MNYEYEELLGRMSLLSSIAPALTSLHEGNHPLNEGRQMTWEQIAVALYDILDDIDTVSDAAKSDDAAFRSMVEKLQKKKNLYMESTDGYTTHRCNEGTVDHAKREIELAGLMDEDADYGGMIGKAVIELMETFASQGHSGMSAMWVLSVFEKLARWENLTDLTNDVNEWNDVSEYSGGNPMWQSRRNPEAFSRDGGKTYYILSELEEQIEEEGVDEETGEPYTYTYSQTKEEYVNNPDAWPMHTAIDPPNKKE